MNIDFGALDVDCLMRQKESTMRRITFTLSALLIASVCNAGTPDTGPDIAKAMPGLDAMHPDLHAMLTDGTFDSMALEQKLLFLGEPMRRRMIADGVGVAQANVVSDSAVESAMRLSDADPEHGKLIMRSAVQTTIDNHRMRALSDLDAESDEPVEGWQDHWYIYSDAHCTRFMFAYPASFTSNPCVACAGFGPGGSPIGSVMLVGVLQWGDRGNCYICARDRPTLSSAASPLDQVPPEVLAPCGRRATLP